MKTHIKLFIKRIFSYMGALCATHPATFYAICLATLSAYFYQAGFFTSWEVEQKLLQLSLSAGIFSLFAFCLESSPLRKRLPRFARWGIGLFAACVSFTLASIYLLLLENNPSILLEKFFKIYAGHLQPERVTGVISGLSLALLLLGIYFSFRAQGGESFSGYCMSLFSKLFFTGLTFSVLVIGAVMLKWVFYVLFFEEGGYPGFSSEIMLLAGGYLFMRVIASFSEPSSEPNVFIVMLTRYVLFIMCLIAYGIVYGYMLKILLMRQIPSNFIFGILTALFCVSIPIAYAVTAPRKPDTATDEMMENQKGMDVGVNEESKEVSEQDITSKPGYLLRLARALPLIFAPLLLLQTYSVIVRILQYGLTPMRYSGILLLVFEIIYIVLHTVLSRKNEARLSVILMILAFCALLSTCVPALNAIDLSRSAQLHCVRAYLRAGAEGVSQGISSRAVAGYSALLGTDVLTDSLTEEERGAMQALLEQQSSDSQRDDFWITSQWTSDIDELDMEIEGYRRIQYAYLMAAGNTDTEGQEPGNADAVNAGLYLGSQLGNSAAGRIAERCDPVRTVDISVFARTMISLENQRNAGRLSLAQFNSSMQAIRSISLSNGGLFYVKYADILYHKVTGDIYSINLDGFYLTP